jgi:hypothetical protein
MTARGGVAVRDDILHSGTKVKGILIMFDTPKEKSEKAKVLRKLMLKWLSVQATEQKATLLLSKNPGIKLSKQPRKKPPPSPFN